MKTPIARLFNDIELLRKTISTLLVRVLGAVSVFFLNYIIAKTLIPKDAGYFFWTLSLIVISTQIAIMGFHDVALKYISFNIRKQDWPAVNYISKNILLWVGTSTVLFAIFLFFISAHIGTFFFPGNTEVTPVIQSMLPGIIFLGLANIIAFQLQAADKQMRAVFTLSIGPYIFFIILFALFESTDPAIAGYTYSIACLINLIISYVWWKKIPPNNDISTFENKQLWNMAYPMWAIAIMAVSVNWGGQFISGHWVSAEDIAHYAVALRAAALINFFLIAMNFVVAPKIAQLYKEQKTQELQKLITNTIWILYILAAPIVIIILIFSNQLMGIFGENFRESGQILLVLTIGQSVNVFTGPVGYLLTMTGNERHMRNMYFLSGTICLISTVILTQAYGIIGTAWGATIAIVVQNIGATYLAYKKVGISVSPFKMKNINQGAI